MLPILSSFYYCPRSDFFLHKTCAELPRRIRSWFVLKPCDLQTDGNCNACGKDLSCEGGFRCKDCKFAVDWRCAILPRIARHKCDQHSLMLAYQDRDDYPLRHYCDICEERRDSRIWFYRCETCDSDMHTECVLGEHPFIKGRSKYTDEDHRHPLAFVKKIYYYPECVLCGEPCQDLSLECVEHGCKYIVHGSCIIPNFPLGFPLSDSDSGSE
ncbi:hypothetical protein GQ457_06G024150 [Hibiscus cannabinus]